MDLNWIRKLFGQCFWFYHDALLFTHLAIVLFYAIFPFYVSRSFYVLILPYALLLHILPLYMFYLSFYLPFLCLSHFLSTVIFIESFTTLLSMFCGQIYIMRITFYQIVENRIFCDYFTLHFYILWIIIVHMLVQLLCTFIPLILLRHSVDLLPKFSFRSLSQCLSLYLYYLRFF